MNIRDISNDALRQVVSEWLEDKEKRAIIDRDPLLHANVEHLEEAQGAFSSLSAQQHLSAAERAKIEATLKKLAVAIDHADGEFARPGRACYALLDAASQIIGDEVTAAQLVAARDRVFPRGLSVLKLSASEEAGVALGMSEALDDELRSLLGHIELRVSGHKISALSLVEQQIEAGKKLGKLVAQRDKVISERDASAEEHDDAGHGSALSRFGQARNTIVQAVSNFARDIHRARKIGASDKALLLSTLERLSSLAGQRGKKSGKEAPVPQPG